MDDNIIKRYLEVVKTILINKYNLDKYLAAKIIKQSYISSIIELYPEECLHEDIEEVSDNIYHDYLEGV